eukprot:7379270-Prymnesium_polylepis.1
MSKNSVSRAFKPIGPPPGCMSSCTLADHLKGVESPQLQQAQVGILVSAERIHKADALFQQNTTQPESARARDALCPEVRRAQPERTVFPNQGRDRAADVRASSQ